jgi:hypothetical protein
LEGLQALLTEGLGAAIWAGLVDTLVEDASLLEHRIGEQTRPNVRMDREFSIIYWAEPDFMYWAEPDFMVALSLAVEAALMTNQNFLDQSRITGHQAATVRLIRSSREK